MIDQIDNLYKDLAKLVCRHTDRDGSQSTEIPSLVSVYFVKKNIVIFHYLLILV